MADVSVNFTGKVRGWNLWGKPGQELESDYWIEWDWTGWIRKQIDYAMSLGANCIRLIGDVAMVQNSLITQTLYNARTQQIIKYCVDNGLSFYLTGCATYGNNGVDNGTTAMTDAQIATIINSNVGSVTGVSGAPDYSANIIGCDIVQEANANMTAGRCNNIYSLVKPNVKAPIGCTFSTTHGLPPDTDAWIASIIGSCDYLDYHIYPQTYGISAQPTPTDVTNGPRTDHPTKEILFGEGGADFTAYTSGQVNAWYVGLATLGNMADAKVRGWLAWAVQDQGVSSGHYGAFDSSWTSRSQMVLPNVQGSAAAAGPSAPPAPSIPHDAVILINPNGTSTDYAGVKVYRDGNLIASPTTGYFDDSANVLPGHQYSYTAKVTTASHGDSAASPALVWSLPPSRGIRP